MILTCTWQRTSFSTEVYFNHFFPGGFFVLCEEVMNCKPSSPPNIEKNVAIELEKH